MKSTKAKKTAPSKTFDVRFDGKRVWLEVVSDNSRFFVDREELRKEIGAAIRESFLSSWPQDEADETANSLSYDGLTYFESHFREALHITIATLMSAASIKACDDWGNEIVNVPGGESVRVPLLEKQRRERRESLLKSVESEWRRVMDFTGEGGLYADPDKKNRYGEALTSWQAAYEDFKGTNNAKSKHANQVTKAAFGITSSNTLKDWLRKARQAQAPGA